MLDEASSSGTSSAAGVLGSDMTPSAGSAQPGSIATASDSEGEGSGDGSLMDNNAAARSLSKTSPATPTTVLSSSPSVDAPTPGAGLLTSRHA